ncbi:hypothetical protein OAF71_01610 [bacterium]|nr:hypothetical protein [bacterium]
MYFWITLLINLIGAFLFSVNSMVSPFNPLPHDESKWKTVIAVPLTVIALGFLLVRPFLDGFVGWQFPGPSGNRTSNSELIRDDDATVNLPKSSVKDNIQAVNKKTNGDPLD